MSKEWSPAEMLQEFGFQTWGTRDMRVIEGRMREERPRMYVLFDRLMRNGQMDWLYEFLTIPPGLVVDEETGDIEITEHGERLAYRFEKENS